MEKIKLAVLGGNVTSYSKSPEIHNNWLKELNLNNYIYQAVDIEKDQLAQFIETLRKEYLGCNVTVPLKEEIIAHLDEIDESAAKINSVNVVKNQGNKLIGYNTDVFGFSKALTNMTTQYNVVTKKALLFGTGAAAKSSYYSLIEELKVTKLIIVTSSESKINVKTSMQPEVIYCNYSSYKSYLANLNIIINATPRDVSKGIFNFGGVKTNCITFDLNYSNAQGAFAKESKRHNTIFSDGNEMLLHQAAASFKIWFDVWPASYQ